MFTRLIVILFLTISHFSNGVDKGAEIIRICADIDRKTATLFWNTPNDNCSSFKKYQIYSSENSGPWKLDTIIFSINQSSKEVFLSDLSSDWKFKIVTYFACNNIDSFSSASQSIDQNRPFQLELDSVSFDYSTQKLSAGWKKNSAADTKGYWLYYETTTDKKKILETDKTFTLLDSFDKNNPSKIFLTTFDSCNLFAPIDTFHQAAYLKATIDSCAKTIFFNWSQYQSSLWANVNQYLVVNRNNTGFFKQVNLSGNQTDYILPGISLGDNLCYYIRTEDIMTKHTSSSNTVCFQTRELKVPLINYLSNVTVDRDKSIKINIVADKYADTDSFLVEKQEGSIPFKPFLWFKFNPKVNAYEIEDIGADFNNKLYTYRIKTFDKCKNTTSVSNIGTSILLIKPVLIYDIFAFKWNLYNGWEKGISNQLIEFSNDRFTWNILKNEDKNKASLLYSKETLDFDSLCFRIKNIEEKNSGNFSATSISNIQCIYSIDNFYIPSAINPFSQNNTLRVFGNGLDKSRGKIEVFNRWGEKIFETMDIENGWDGTINGSAALIGNYLYKASFYDQQNKYYLKTGTVFIFR